VEVNGHKAGPQALTEALGVAMQIEHEASIGEKVNRYMALTTLIEGHKAERAKVEADLKAEGIRLPGMTRARKVKAATRTRKTKVTEATEGIGA